MKKRTVLAISAIMLLYLSGTSSVWGQDCHPVSIGQYVLEEILVGPENCNGYDLCAFSVIRGTLNGNWSEFLMDADAVQVDATTFSYKADAVIETKHGDLYFEERSIVNWAAPDGYALVANVTGGTGRYEGATGWLVSFANLENTFSRTAGEICYADE